MNTQFKKYLFAQYIGQEVLMHPTLDFAYTVTGNNLLGEQYAKDCYLLLRPLSSITDAEAIEVAKITSVLPDDGLIVERDTTFVRVYDSLNDTLSYGQEYWRDVVTIPFNLEVWYYDNGGDVNQCDVIRAAMIYQYLQQQGIALPIYFNGEHYSVERQVNEGCVKLIA